MDYLFYKGISRTAISGDAAGGLKILDNAGTGKRNRIYKITLTSRSSVAATPMDFLISGGCGTFFGDTGTPLVLDFGPTGYLQNADNTAIAITSDTTCEVGAVVVYSVE